LIFSVDSVSGRGHIIRVSFESVVEVELDGADVGRTHEADGEEAVSPVADEVDTLVRLEHVGVSLEVAGINWLEVASNMTSVVGAEGGGRVKSVVVTRGEVYHEIHDFVASRFGSLELLVAYFEAFVGLAAVEELIESVIVALDALQGAVFGVNFTKAENCTVARRDKRVRVELIRNWSGLGFQLPREELVERGEIVEVLDLSFVKLNIVHSSKAFIEGGPEVGWKSCVAEKSSQLTDSSADRQKVLDKPVGNPVASNK